MKKLIKSGLLSAALLATVVVNASEKLNVKVSLNTSKLLSISLTEVTSGEYIKIKDYNGQVLFSEQLKKSDNYRKLLSFSALPEGLYFIESKEETKIQVTPVLVSPDRVTLVDSSVKTYLAPEITFSGDDMMVLVRNYNNSPVSITVYNESGTLLSETENNTNTLVFKHFNTEELPTQKIIVSVSEGDYNFVKEIKL